MKRFLLARGASAGERAAQLDFKKGFIVGKVVLPDKTEACRFHLHPESKSSTVLQKKKKKKKSLFASEPQVLIDENLLITHVI